MSEYLNSAKEIECSSFMDFSPILIIAPHQDDESLGCGGTIALATEFGIETYVVFLSDGSQSHPASKKYPHNELIKLREDEAVSALSVLGVHKRNIFFMRMPDGGLPFSIDPDFDNAVSKLLNLLNVIKPGVVFLPWRRDSHRDHKATWQIAANAMKLVDKQFIIFEYFIWLWERAAQDDHPKSYEGKMCYVDISTAVETKRRAILTHISQTTDLIDDDKTGFKLSAEMLAHFDHPKEYFIQTTLNYMEENLHSLSENYFDEVYRQKDDPWDLATSNYERDKYNATLAALPRDKYEHAFEIGCSIGVLTEALLQKCTKILAVDVADAPVGQAKERLAKYPQATIKKMTVPETFPKDNFDLVVMSEVGYFFSFADLKILADKIYDHLNEGGQLLLVHWTHFVADFPLTGDQVHESFLNQSGTEKHFKHLFHQHTDDYRLDLFEKQ